MRARLLGPVLLALAVAGCGASDTPSGRDDGAGSGQVTISTAGWETDFDKHNVPLSEFQSGGPGRDGIPPVDEPKPVDQEQAEEFLDDKEPVLVAEAGGDARAYPVQILIWHEIVNDDLAGRPIAVTYCPLCNSSLVFDRRVEGETLTFGTTGNLRKSDLVMWDRQTESWWQQLTGEAVVGALTGTKLEALPSQTLSWSDFKERYPDGDVLSRDTGHDRDYGANPYEGYDTADQQPFLLDGEADRRLPPKERVAAAFVGDEVAVVPFPRLARERVVNAEVGGRPLVFLFKPGVRSALDAGAINDSKDVGTAAAFERTLDGRELELRAEGDGFVDRDSGSRFDITGRAVSGPLEGRRLPQVRHDQQFWFALAAFVPDARILD
ncbi:MAG: DUF3179 domain-containing protein [Actinomycetota bacterium]|nr:DUF3179 domain-containing protein [Actinomycetota bacterium]